MFERKGQKLGSVIVSKKASSKPKVKEAAEPKPSEPEKKSADDGTGTAADKK